MVSAKELQTASVADRFDHLLSVIGSQKFLRMEGLGKEVPFFVIPYGASEAIEMSKLKNQLISKLKFKGIRVLEVNLYDLTKELMEKRVFEGQTDWDFWIEKEAAEGKDELLKGCPEPC